MPLFGLFGASGCGRDVMPYVKRQLHGSGVELCFVEREASQEPVHGLPVLSEAQFLAYPGEKRFNVAINDPKIREAVAARIEPHARPLAICAETARVLDENELQAGSILSAYAVVTSNVRLGRYVHLNTHVSIAHDCVIGDFVTFAPGARCNGNVRIGSHAWIGSGALLRHGTAEKPLTIGEGAVVGMGAVVIQDVAPFTTVVGNPARVLER